MMKNRALQLAAISAAAMTLMACGKQEAAAPAPTPAPAADPAAASSAASPAASAAAAAAADPLKVAFVYIGPVGDGGWTYAHDNARKAMEAALPAGSVSTSFVENVPESADAERVVRDLASQGNKLIFASSFGYMESVVKVARDFPDVKFEHATGYKTAENMRTYDSRTYEGAYLAGVVAGAMSKSNTVGVVGSVPIPEVLRNINAFTLGAQTTNPNITTKVVWVNEWFNPPKETEAATALINGGADILMQNTDSSAVLQTAEKMGKRGFGWNSDMTSYGPKAHLGSAIINWAPYYTKAVGEAQNGTWATGTAWWGVKEGAIDLISLADDVPEAARKKVDEVRAGLKDGSYQIWKSPLSANDGSIKLAEGSTADDAFLKGMNFYVKGVDGKVPGAK